MLEAIELSKRLHMSEKSKKTVSSCAGADPGGGGGGRAENKKINKMQSKCKNKRVKGKKLLKGTLTNIFMKGCAFLPLTKVLSRIQVYQ